MHNGYRFGELGPGESLQSPSVCDCCGREDLKRTVKLINPGGAVVWYGCGCAARVMGLAPKTVRAAKKAAEEQADTAARLAREAEHRASDALWQAFLDSAAGPVGDRFKQIEALGGYAAARVRFAAR